MQQTLDVSNEVAAELAGIGDSVLDALRDRLGTTIRLRGNQLTIEGDEGKVVEARAVVDELVELVEGGHEIGPGTVDAVLGALDQAEERELAVLEEFMPEPLSEDELERIVDDAIAENGATSMGDLGRVMADVMPQVAGRADGSAVSQLVREKLA